MKKVIPRVLSFQLCGHLKKEIKHLINCLWLTDQDALICVWVIYKCTKNLQCGFQKRVVLYWRTNHSLWHIPACNRISKQCFEPTELQAVVHKSYFDKKHSDRGRRRVEPVLFFYKLCLFMSFPLLQQLAFIKFNICYNKLQVWCRNLQNLTKSQGFLHQKTSQSPSTFSIFFDWNWL